jgi:ribose transport system substrate-binding protein
MKHRLFVLGIALLMLLLAACDSGGGTTTTLDSSEDASASGVEEGSEDAAAGGDGETVRIAFSAPGADHGWLAAITTNAEAAAEELGDVELELLEGTNDAATQSTQIEQLVADDPDALVILPHDGEALTDAAQEAMDAGIPVINVDRKFSTAQAYRTFIGGDNYGIGVSAGNYFADELGCEGKVVEIQGLAGISVTEDRSQGFRDAIEQCNGGIEIVASQPADFVPDKGLQVMETILQAEDEIDAVYTHDDDMAEGVVSAIENAGREEEMFLTGAGGSGAAMDRIAEGGLYRATFMYNPSMSGSAVNLARLIALGEGMTELTEPDVPSEIVLPAATVTADNVEQYRDLGF